MKTHTEKDLVILNQSELRLDNFCCVSLILSVSESARVRLILVEPGSARTHAWFRRKQPESERLGNFQKSVASAQREKCTDCALWRFPWQGFSPPQVQKSFFPFAKTTFLRTNNGNAFWISFIQIFFFTLHSTTICQRWFLARLFRIWQNGPSNEIKDRYWYALNFCLIFVGDFIINVLSALDDESVDRKLRHQFDGLMKPYFNPSTETSFENAMEGFGNVLDFKKKFIVVSARITDARLHKCENIEAVSKSDKETGYNHYSPLSQQLEDLIIDCVSFFQGLKVYVKRIKAVWVRKVHTVQCGTAPEKWIHDFYWNNNVDYHLPMVQHSDSMWKWLTFVKMGKTKTGAPRQEHQCKFVHKCWRAT